MNLSPLAWLFLFVFFSPFGNTFGFKQSANRTYRQLSTVVFLPKDTIRKEMVLKPVRFGVKTGGHLSNMNFNKGHSGVSGHLDPAWKIGFTGGLMMQVHLHGRFYLVQEYLISRVRGTYQPFKSHYTFDYLSLPTIFHYAITPKLTVLAGPQWEILLYGKERVGNNQSPATQMTEERNIGMVLGIQCAISDQVNVSGRFMHGFNHIGLYQRMDRREFKYEQVQFSTTFVF